MNVSRGHLFCLCAPKIQIGFWNCSNGVGLKKNFKLFLLYVIRSSQDSLFFFFTNRKEEVVMKRCINGHTRLTHRFILKSYFKLPTTT